MLPLNHKQAYVQVSQQILFCHSTDSGLEKKKRFPSRSTSALTSDLLHDQDQNLLCKDIIDIL